MTKYLLNNTEQVQPNDTDRTDIVLYGRTPHNPDERHEIRVRGFGPYFYALKEETEGREQELLRHDCIQSISETEIDGLRGQELCKICVPYPQDTPTARDLFEESWEADVPFTNRFRTDCGVRAYIEIPDEVIDGTVAVVDYEDIEPLEEGSGSVVSDV